MWGFPKSIFKPHEYWLCKACCRNSTYRLRYWNSLERCCRNSSRASQQYLPFTVLKLNVDCLYSCFLSWSQQYLPFTVLKLDFRIICWNPFDDLSQQYLPFTVLKRFLWHWICQFRQSQQYLPFTVLKLALIDLATEPSIKTSRNSTYRLRYWNLLQLKHSKVTSCLSRNSTYCLRYWNFYKSSQERVNVLSIFVSCVHESQQYLPFTVLKLFITQIISCKTNSRSQQYLPFTVLKPPLTTCSS